MMNGSLGVGSGRGYMALKVSKTIASTSFGTPQQEEQHASRPTRVYREHFDAPHTWPKDGDNAGGRARGAGGFAKARYLDPKSGEDVPIRSSLSYRTREHRRKSDSPEQNKPEQGKSKLTHTKVKEYVKEGANQGGDLAQDRRRSGPSRYDIKTVASRGDDEKFSFGSAYDYSAAPSTDEDASRQERSPNNAWKTSLFAGTDSLRSARKRVAEEPKADSDSLGHTPSPRPMARRTRRTFAQNKRTRAETKRIEEANRANELEPIELNSDSDEDSEGDGPGPPPMSPSSSPLPSSVRRSRRLGAGAPKLSHLVRGLKATYRSPRAGGAAISIFAKDLDCLEDGEFLNDTVIDYYINHLLDERALEAERAARKAAASRPSGFFSLEESDDSDAVPKEICFVFSTFFYKKLTSGNKQHEKVGKWTKNVDIFAHKYIFVPVCANYHWSLALVHVDKMPGNKVNFQILHMDSMRLAHRTDLITKPIRLYLANEWHRSIEQGEGVASEVDGPKQTPTASPASDEGGDASDEDGDASDGFKTVPSSKDMELPDLSPFTMSSTGTAPGKRQFNARTVIGTRVQCPLQDNYCDCGLFLLKCLERFLVCTPTKILVEDNKARYKVKGELRHKVTAMQGREEMPKFFRRNWFTQQEARSLRQKLREMVCSLILEQNPDQPAAKKAMDVCVNGA